MLFAPATVCPNPPPPPEAARVLLRCGLVSDWSEPLPPPPPPPEPERLLGLRSSSDRERLMGRVCIGLLREGVDGGCCCWRREEAMEGSLDQDGTGGRVWLGDERAGFLEGCCEGVGGGWAKGIWEEIQSVDC